MIQYDTIGDFNVDAKTKTNKRHCSFNSVQVKNRDGSPEWIRVTMQESICERDEV